MYATEAMGVFTLLERAVAGGRPVYRNQRDRYLYYWPPSAGWRIADNYTDRAAAEHSAVASFSGGAAACPTDASSWRVWSPSRHWFEPGVSTRCQLGPPRAADEYAASASRADEPPPPLAPPPPPAQSGPRVEWWVPLVIVLSLLVCIFSITAICCFSLVLTVWKRPSHAVGRPEVNKSRAARALRALDSSSCFSSAVAGSVRFAGVAGAEKASAVQEAL